MRTIRRLGGVAIAGLLLGAFVSGPASADTPAVYAGSASGQALVLTVAGSGQTGGSSTAKAASDGTASATGAGQVGNAATTADAKTGETKPQVCAATLPGALSALPLAFGLACGQAAAPVGAPTATGKVGTVAVNLQTILQLVPVTTLTTTTLNSILTQICAGASAIPVVGTTTCTLTSTVTTLDTSITSTQTLTADEGSSTSSVTAGATNVTSESTASGTVIKLLPSPTIQGVVQTDPVATITIARAEAKAICDLSTGKATPSFDPAIVRVKLSAPILALLPALSTDVLPTITLPSNPLVAVTIDPTTAFTNGELTLTPGSTLTLFPGTPIETQIIVGAGSTTSNPDGSVSATADGVKINAIKNIGTVAAPLAGGLLFELAHATAAVGCSPAVVTPPPPPAAPTVDTPRELPRTGGTSPWLPAVGIAGLALAVLTRRVLVRAR